MKSLRMRRLITGFRNRIGNHLIPVNKYIFKDTGSNELFSFVFIGWEKKLCYYWISRLSSIFEKVGSQKSIKTLKKVHHYLHNGIGETDLAVIESGTGTISDNYCTEFLLPRWIEMELDIESSLKSNTMKKAKKIIKKYSFDYEIREGTEALNLFYKMYEPFTNKKHGRHAYVADYDYFYKIMSSNGCFLFFLTRENEPVATAFIEKKINEYRLTAVGIKDGSEEMFKIGVTLVLRYFILQYFLERNVNTLFIGSCMPVILDGVTEYKLHIGAKPYLKDVNVRRKFYFIPTNSKPITQKVLKANPLFYISGNSLDIALFVGDGDYNTKKEFFQFLNIVKTSNAGITRLFYFDRSEQIRQWLNEEKIYNIEFVKYEGTIV